MNEEKIKKTELNAQLEVLYTLISKDDRVPETIKQYLYLVHLYLKIK